MKHQMIIAVLFGMGCGSGGGGAPREDPADIPGDTGDGGRGDNVVEILDTVGGDLAHPDEISNLDTGDEFHADDSAADVADTSKGDEADPGPVDPGPSVACTLDALTCPPGEHCVPAGELGSLVCRPFGTTPPGGPCSKHEDCQKGSACAAYDEDIGFCKPLCAEGVACPETFQVCFPFFGPGGATAGACLGSDCTPPAEGCPEGQRCTVLDNQVLECVPAGAVGSGGECSTMECQAGTLCLVIEGEARCRPFCRAASGCVAEDDHCVFPWSFTEFGFCHPGCDPVLQEGCPDGQGCYFSDPEVGSTLCWEAGALEEGADCSNFTEFCRPGLDCILQPGTDPFEYRCRAWCDAEHPCPPGTSCQFPPASPVMGVCLPSGPA